jgi:hypothetical protein
MRCLLLLALLAGCSKPHEPVRVIATERPAPAQAAPAAHPASAPVSALTVTPKPRPTPSVERSPLLIPAHEDIPHSEMGNDALRAAVEARGRQ